MPQLPSIQRIAPTVLPQTRVALLMDYAREGAADPRVAKIARALVEARSRVIGRNLTPAEAAQALADGVHELVDYVPDPPGEEVFQSAVTTLGNACGRGPSPLTGGAKGCGDCEDLAVLLAAFCMALGIRAQVVWMEQPGAPLNHVSAQVCVDPALPDCWQWLDATLPGARLGEHPYDALARVGDAFRARVFGPAPTRPAGSLTDGGAMLSVREMPPGGTVSVGGRGLGGNWLGGEERQLAWEVDVPPDLLGPQVVIVDSGRGPRRAARVEFAPGANVDLPWSAMRDRTELILNGLPRGVRAVEIDGRAITGQWLDDAQTRWAGWLGGEYTFGDPHAVTVVDADGRRATTQVVFVPAASTEVEYRAMAPDARGRLVVVGMPHGGTVALDGRPLGGGTWLDAGMTRWALDVPPDLVGALRTVMVRNAAGQELAARVTPTAGATTEVEYAAMQRAPDAPSPPTGPRVVIEGMPHGGTVAIGGTPIVSDSTWLDAEMTRWAVPVPPGMAGTQQEILVTPPRGARDARPRFAVDTLPAVGDLSVPFLDMVAREVVRPGVVVPVFVAPPVGTVDAARPARVVIVGMPHGGRVTVDGQTPSSGTWLDAALTRWAVPVPPGLAGGTRTVAVLAPDGTERSKRIALAAEGDTEVAYEGLRPTTGGSTPGAVTRAARVVIVGMPHGGTVAIDGQPGGAASWLDAAMTRWAVDVPPALAGASREVAVTNRSGARATARVAVPAEGDVEVPYAGMTGAPGATEPGARMPPRIVIVGFPAGGIVQADARVLSVGTWLDAAMTRWAVSVPSDLVNRKVDLAVTAPDGARRQRAVETPVEGDVEIAYADLAPSTPAPRPEGRVVVRGAGANAEASVVRVGEGGALSALLFLRPDPAGYLAATLPVGEGYGLTVRVATGLGTQTFAAPVTIALNADSVYDLTADGLVFRPQVTDARANPQPEGGVLAQSGRALLTVTGVPDDGNAPGAVAATGASAWVVEARLLPPMEGVSLPGTPPRPPAPWTPLQKRSPGVYTAELSPGLTDVRVFRRAGGRDGLDERSAQIELTFGPNSLDFNAMRSVGDGLRSTRVGVVRVTGVPAGWSVSIGGNVEGAPVSCENPDACSAPHGGNGGTALVTLARGNIRTVREVSLPRDRSADVTVDVGFDSRRAQAFAAGTLGVTGVDPRGIRSGYWSDLALVSLRGLPDATLRRTVKEFERVTPPGADGRAVYAVFSASHGMVPIAATEREARALARDLGLVSSGRMTPEGRYPFEIVVPLRVPVAAPGGAQVTP